MSDVAHDSAVPRLDDNAPAIALDDAGGEKGHVPRLQHVRVRPLRAQTDCLTLTSQPGVVNLVR
jgi:hypothetical protein